VNVFACKALGCRLTVSACAKRVRASREAGNSFKGAGLMSGDCRSCAVGREHQLGREPAHWPDGSPVVRLRLASAAPQAAEKPAIVEVPTVPGLLVTKAEAKRKRETRKRERAPTSASSIEKKRARQRRSAERIRRKSGVQPRVFATRYTWGDRSLTPFQWAREPEAREAGLSGTTIRERLLAGWPIEKALTLRPGATWAKHELGGEALSLRAWAARAGLAKDTLQRRLDRGWSLEKAVTTPARQAGRSEAGRFVHTSMPEHGSEQRKGATS
jgi:hypothetical protein